MSLGLPGREIQGNGSTHEMCVGADPRTEPVQLSFFLGGRSWSLAFSCDPQPDQCGEVLGAWPYKAGQTSGIATHWSYVKTGTPQPTRTFCQLNQPLTCSAAGVTFQLPSEGRRAQVRKKQPGHQPENWGYDTVSYVLGLRFALPGSVAAPYRRLLRQRQHSLEEDVAASLQPTVAAAVSQIQEEISEAILLTPQEHCSAHR